jgi:hypothetical protein
MMKLLALAVLSAAAVESPATRLLRRLNSVPDTTISNTGVPTFFQKVGMFVDNIITGPDASLAKGEGAWKYVYHSYLWYGAVAPLTTISLYYIATAANSVAIGFLVKFLLLTEVCHTGIVFFYASRVSKLLEGQGLQSTDNEKASTNGEKASVDEKASTNGEKASSNGLLGIWYQNVLAELRALSAAVVAAFINLIGNIIVWSTLPVQKKNLTVNGWVWAILIAPFRGYGMLVTIWRIVEINVDAKKAEMEEPEMEQRYSTTSR